MKTLTADRRSHVRTQAAYKAVVTDRKGRVVLRGRTTNLSDRGAFVVGSAPRGVPHVRNVVVEMHLPETKVSRGGHRSTRKVRYLARVVRRQTLGQMLGMGVELLEKLT